MKKYCVLIGIIIMFFSLTGIALATDDEETTEDRFIIIKGDWFFAYQVNLSDRENAFKLKRGYLTVEKQFNDIFSARYTQDITIDQEGDDAGNVELRFKYCYLKTELPDLGFFKHSYVQVGLVPRPLIDFEASINDYLLQGKMYLDRMNIISSADFGLTAVTLLGGKMDENYLSKVSSSFPGKYGSIAIGIYNGGGYNSLEYNNNKTIEGRFTLRPLSAIFPGLQFSYNMAIGHGNDTLQTPFRVHSFFLSHETRYTTFTAQYYLGTGNQNGYSWNSNRGYSFFGELCVPKLPITLFGRYDYFHSFILGSIIGEYETTQVIVGGIAWKFYKNNRLLLDIDKTTTTFPYWAVPSQTSSIVTEIALEIVF